MRVSVRSKVRVRMRVRVRVRRRPTVRFLIKSTTPSRLDGVFDLSRAWVSTKPDSMKNHGTWPIRGCRLGYSVGPLTGFGPALVGASPTVEAKPR